MRVSVIIPAHNAASTVASTLESLETARAHIFEILLVDDCSRDETAQIAIDTARNLDLPLKILSCAYRDAGAARNLGIEESKGEWIYFLDADDLHVSDGIGILLAEAGRRPEVGLVAGAYRRIVDGRPRRKKRPNRLSEHPLTNARYYLSGRIRSFPVGTVLVSRQAIGTYRFPRQMPYDEDTVFWTAVLTATRASTVQACVLIYQICTLRAEKRFLKDPVGAYLRWRRALRILSELGVPGFDAEMRAGIVALKIARVNYARGRIQTAARFLSLAAKPSKSPANRWRRLRYVMKVAIAARVRRQVDAEALQVGNRAVDDA